MQFMASTKIFNYNVVSAFFWQKLPLEKTAGIFGFFYAFIGLYFACTRYDHRKHLKQNTEKKIKQKENKKIKLV